MSIMDINVAIEMVVIEEVDTQPQTISLPPRYNIDRRIEEAQEKIKVSSLEELP